VRRVLRNRLSLALLGVVATATLGLTLSGTDSAADVATQPASGAGASTGAQAAPSAAMDTGTLAATADAAAAPAATSPQPPAPPASLVLEHDTAQQPNYFYCGPAAIRNALTAFGRWIDMDHLAGQLGTTVNGTPSSFDIERVLNAHMGEGRYRTVEVSDRRPSAEQVATLRSDIVANINEGDPVVVNSMGSVTDTDGQVHSFPNGHYVVVVGYDAYGDLVHISDSADPDGDPEYMLRVTDLANWIATRGYAA
jgi:nucleoid-associated protein YgaU